VSNLRPPETYLDSTQEKKRCKGEKRGEKSHYDRTITYEILLKKTDTAVEYSNTIHLSSDKHRFIDPPSPSPLPPLNIATATLNFY
jgi:hypothetical protein